MTFEEWDDYGTHSESPCRDMYADWKAEREKLLERIKEVEDYGKEYIAKTDPLLENMEKMYDDREKLIEVLEWIKLQPQKCQKIMREHNWKYEDSEDFNQKMIFTMYSHVVGCAAKSEYILIELNEKGG